MRCCASLSRSWRRYSFGGSRQVRLSTSRVGARKLCASRRASHHCPFEVGSSYGSRPYTPPIGFRQSPPRVRLIQLDTYCGPGALLWMICASRPALARASHIFQLMSLFPEARSQLETVARLKEAWVFSLHSSRRRTAGELRSFRRVRPPSERIPSEAPAGGT